MSESQANDKEIVELIVMLKNSSAQADMAPIAQSVSAQIVEIKTMFGDKIVGVLTVDASGCDAALNALQNDNRVELAQINRTYKHC